MISDYNVVDLVVANFIWALDTESPELRIDDAFGFESPQLVCGNKVEAANTGTLSKIKSKQRMKSEKDLTIFLLCCFGKNTIFFWKEKN